MLLRNVSSNTNNKMAMADIDYKKPKINVYL